MATVSEIAVEYSARGAAAAQRADEGVRSSIQETAKTARSESGEIDRWMDRHKTAIQLIGVATLAAMGAITSASPALRAETSAMRMEFSLLLMTLGDHLQPAFERTGDGVRWVREQFEDLPGPVQSVIAHLTFLGALLAGAAGVLATLQSLLAGTFVATLGGTVVGAIQTAVAGLAAFVAGSLGAIVVIGALLGILAVAALEVTGVNDRIREFGRSVGERLPDWLRDGMLAFMSIFLTPLSIVGAAITGFVQGYLEDGLRGGVRGAVDGVRAVLTIFFTAWANTLGRVRDIITEFVDRLRTRLAELRDRITDWAGSVRDRVEDRFGDLVDAAHRWGGDLIDEFVDGFRSALPSLSSAIDRAEDRIASGLSYDIAANDREARTWGSDFVEEWTSGAEGEQDRFGDVGGGLVETLPSGGGNGGRSVSIGEINVTVESTGSPRTDGQEVADQVSQTLQDEFGARGG